MLRRAWVLSKMYAEYLTWSFLGTNTELDNLAEQGLTCRGVCAFLTFSMLLFQLGSVLTIHSQVEEGLMEQLAVGSWR